MGLMNCLTHFFGLTSSSIGVGNGKFNFFFKISGFLPEIKGIVLTAGGRPFGLVYSGIGVVFTFSSVIASLSTSIVSSSSYSSSKGSSSSIFLPDSNASIKDNALRPNSVKL